MPRKIFEVAFAWARSDAVFFEIISSIYYLSRVFWVDKYIFRKCNEIFSLKDDSSAKNLRNSSSSIYSLHSSELMNLFHHSSFFSINTSPIIIVRKLSFNSILNVKEVRQNRKEKETKKSENIILYRGHFCANIDNMKWQDILF
jgi:hypothetical protein